MALLNALLALATLLPVLSASRSRCSPRGCCSARVFLSVVASTTALVRHNLPPAAWPAGISALHDRLRGRADRRAEPSAGSPTAPAGSRAGFACSAAVLALGARWPSRRADGACARPDGELARAPRNRAAARARRRAPRGTPRIARGAPATKPDAADRRPSRTRRVAPADHAVAPQQRQRVVAELALRRRRVGLEAVGPAPEELEAAAVPDDRVERREQPHALVGRVPRRRAGSRSAGQYQSTPSTRACASRACARGSARLQLAAPLRHARSAAGATSWPRLGAGSGAYLRDDDVDQRVDARAPRRRRRRPGACSRAA